MKLKLAPAVCCISLACASLLVAQKPGRQLVPKAPDFVEVVNEERPQAPFVEVKFVLDLTLKQEGWITHSLLIGKDGSIHAFSGKKMTRFDAAGRETLSRDFNSGQGPGEFGFFEAELAPDGRFVVLDARQRRITAFDKNFRLLGMSKINFWGDNFIFDSHSDMYLLVMKFLPGTTDRRLLVLTKCSADGKPVREVYEYEVYEWGATRDARGIYHSDAYRTQVIYQIDQKDNLWYVATDRYEINVVSPEGMLVRRIVKKGRTRKLTDGEIAGFQPNDPLSRIVTDIPDRVPPIAGLFLLDQDFVLVVTFESRPEDRELVGDIFDAQGIYRGRVRLPKYEGWDFLMVPNKPQAKACGGFFYTVETPEDGEGTFIRRYKILINRGS